MVTSLSATKIVRRRLVWHRNRDLRFHDHPFYNHDDDDEDDGHTETASLFVFDDAFGCGIQPSTCLPNEWKAVHLGPHGMRVLLESVRDLRANSRNRRNHSNPTTPSHELLVRRGPTVPTVLKILQEMVRFDCCQESSDHDEPPSTTATTTTTRRHYRYEYEICWMEEPGWHERALSERMKVALAQAFTELRTKWSCDHRTIRLSLQTALSCTLYHPDDLPSPGAWQPLSKKEQRRRQKQKQNQQQQSASQKPNTVGKVRSDIPNDDNNNNNNLPGVLTTNFVDVSLDRWTKMPRIMGDFRKIARERAGIRDCRPARASVEIKRHTHINDTAKGLSQPSHRRLPIDPGRMPTLEELLQPLRKYLDDDTDEKQPILGLPDEVIRTVCQNALRIHRRNLGVLSKAATHGEATAELRLMGGETAGLKHLDHFVLHHAHTAERSLACVEHHRSSRLSHYLAFGCLSPRKVVAAAEAAIAARRTEIEPGSATNDHKNPKENDGTWLISHMTMRDFFLYTCLAAGKQFYRLEGIPVSQKVASSLQWRSFDERTGAARKLWIAWAMGDTGLPLVDAAMTELMETGYASNRVRQNAASLLTKDLQLDWRAGAEWFQFLLEDHCVGANWGNWLYFSGVGPDPKNRHFCTISQALKYDPGGEYVWKWNPRLRRNHNNNNNYDDDDDDKQHEEYFLRPWDFDPSWKAPIVDPETQYTWRDLERLKETDRLLEEKSCE